MENSKQFLFYAAFFVLITSTACWIPRIINGRPKGGKMGAPKAPVGVKLPPSQWFQFQRQDHFDGSNNKVWRQVSRYAGFVCFAVLQGFLLCFHFKDELAVK